MTRAKAFINDDFLLTTKAARELYHRHAEKMPIIDYHCHLPPADIAADRRWADIAEVWLGGDHYKWRQMRSNGVDERYCTGDAPWREKFVKFAETLERLVRNPLYDWSHLELARYFGVTEILNGASAARIWKKCNARLAGKGFSARALMQKSNVKVVCTTDDPVDSLEHHLAVAAKPFGTQIRPAWRSDKASKIENPRAWNAWIDRLAAAAKTPVKSYEDFLCALARRHDFFAKAGCVVSDYGITEIFSAPYTEAEVARIFKKARAGRPVTGEEALKFKSAWLFEGLKADAKANWTTQLHYNCLRDNNSALFERLGPDTGFDCIGDWSSAQDLARLFDRLEREDALPRCIVYSLNPKDNEMLASLIGCFQKAPARGKLQLGAAWWFLDQKDGMRRQLDALSTLGCLGNFVGMLTDSRSFLSYTRHEYFRRLLCQKLGEEVEKGEIPRDLKWLGGIVEDISFNNANRYFGFDAG
ncbi:MAG: glucuronate isomerase [Kiritimatiellae bacterium]|nr:glucuronate isomerase [Kiritimatiellia bacterium]